MKVPDQPARLVTLDVSHPVWERFPTIAPLVIIGTRQPDGTYNLAPKHMVTPLGWGNHFGFVCTPDHRTYINALREGFFTVSYPRPSQVLLASLSAAGRDDDGSKPALAAIPTVPATTVDGVHVAGSYVMLECELERVVAKLGEEDLVAGRIVAARADAEVLRGPDVDDNDLIARSPLLGYVHPGRWVRIDRSSAFPYHAGFKR